MKNLDYDPNYLSALDSSLLHWDDAVSRTRDNWEDFNTRGEACDVCQLAKKQGRKSLGAYNCNCFLNDNPEIICGTLWDKASCTQTFEDFYEAAILLRQAIKVERDRVAKIQHGGEDKCDSCAHDYEMSEQKFHAGDLVMWQNELCIVKSCTAGLYSLTRIKDDVTTTSCPEDLIKPLTFGSVFTTLGPDKKPAEFVVTGQTKKGDRRPDREGLELGMITGVIVICGNGVPRWDVWLVHHSIASGYWDFELAPGIMARAYENEIYTLVKASNGNYWRWYKEIKAHLMNNIITAHNPSIIPKVLCDLEAGGKTEAPSAKGGK